MKFLVLFLFLFALNGGNDNFPQIRAKNSASTYNISGGATMAVHRFEDKDNTCYVVEGRTYGGISVAISCVKAGGWVR